MSMAAIRTASPWHVFTLAVTLLAGAGLARPATAQTVTGTLQGLVRDTTEAALPGATVSIMRTTGL